MSADESGITGRIGESRLRRERLHVAMVDLEKAAAIPSGTADWQATIRKSIEGLQAAWERHVQGAEGDDGLFDQILLDAPRLAHQIDVLRGEHDEIGAEIAKLLQGVDSEPDVPGIRRQIMAILNRLIGHRHLGADLVYEAYNVDIGGRG